MIKRNRSKHGADMVKITFAVPIDDVDAPVSVVGDFNDWDPLANPMQRRSNGTRSTAVELPAGERAEFRYLVDGGQWLDEPDADDHVTNEYGVVNAVVVA